MLKSTDGAIIREALQILCAEPDASGLGGTDLAAARAQFRVLRERARAMAEIARITATERGLARKLITLITLTALGAQILLPDDAEGRPTEYVLAWGIDDLIVGALFFERGSGWVLTGNGGDS